MFIGVTAGWLVLFLVSLFAFERDGAGWWLRVVVSGLFLIGSAALAVNLWRRRST